MPCIPFLGGIVCIRGRREKPRHCWVRHCDDPVTKLCDWPMDGKKTCDRNICDGHADEVGPDRHYCPAHSIEKAKSELKTGR